MGLQGEWWIDDMGGSTYADGDVGDLNHVIIAFYTALGLNWEDPEVAVRPDKSFTPAQVQALLAFGSDPEAVEYLKSGRKDARDYMMRRHGWIRVASGFFQLVDLDDTALRRIQDFIYAEYPEDENPLEDAFVIEEVKPEGLHLRFTGQELLESGKSAAALKYSAQRERPEWHNPLHVTPKQHAAMLDFKINFIVMMDPQDFLDLTVPDKDFIKFLKYEAQTLDEYNAYNTSLPPYLRIEIGSGEVTGHEGRHRAVAVLKNGENTFPVGIMLLNNGVPSREYCIMDSPLVWTSQFAYANAKYYRQFYIHNLHSVLETNVQERYQKAPKCRNESWDRRQLVDFTEKR